MYLVLESQTNSNGVVSTLIDQYETINAAENKYYTILASATISEIPVHSAFIFTDKGELLASKCYDRSGIHLGQNGVEE